MKFLKSFACSRVRRRALKVTFPCVFILTGGRKSVPRIVEEGDCGTLLPLTEVEHVEETSEKGALEGRVGSADGGAAAIGGGGGRADDGLK